MGGATPGFNKTGKIWKQKGHLTSHLGQLWQRTGSFNNHHIYLDCEIVPYDLVETPAGPGVTIESYLDEIKQRKEARETAYADKQEIWKKEQRRIEYEKLRSEFE